MVLPIVDLKTSRTNNPNTAILLGQQRKNFFGILLVAPHPGRAAEQHQKAAVPLALAPLLLDCPAPLGKAVFAASSYAVVGMT